MQTIHVTKKFTLNLGQEDHLHFEPGVYDVDDHVANHWYTKQHLKGATPVKPAPKQISQVIPQAKPPVEEDEVESDSEEELEGDEEENTNGEDEAPVEGKKKSKKKKGK